MNADLADRERRLATIMVADIAGPRLDNAAAIFVRRRHIWIEVVICFL